MILTTTEKALLILFPILGMASLFYGLSGKAVVGWKDRATWWVIFAAGALGYFGAPAVYYLSFKSCAADEWCTHTMAEFYEKREKARAEQQKKLDAELEEKRKHCDVSLPATPLCH